VIGGIQCVLGAAASVFAYLVYASPSIRETLSIIPEEVFLLILLFLVFSVVSIASGIILIREDRWRVK